MFAGWGVDVCRSLQIRNRNTREAYLHAVRDFLHRAETEARIEDLLDIEPLHVAAWVEIKTQTYEAQSVKRERPFQAVIAEPAPGLISWDCWRSASSTVAA